MRPTPVPFLGHIQDPSISQGPWLGWKYPPTPPLPTPHLPAHSYAGSCGTWAGSKCWTCWGRTDIGRSYRWGPPACPPASPLHPHLLWARPGAVGHSTVSGPTLWRKPGREVAEKGRGSTRTERPLRKDHGTSPPRSTAYTPHPPHAGVGHCSQGPALTYSWCALIPHFLVLKNWNSYIPIDE